jgi:hypothetical protein
MDRASTAANVSLENGEQALRDCQKMHSPTSKKIERPDFSAFQLENQEDKNSL